MLKDRKLNHAGQEANFLFLKLTLDITSGKKDKLLLHRNVLHFLSPLTILPSELFHVQMNGRLFGGLSAADRKTFDLFPLLTH